MSDDVTTQAVRKVLPPGAIPGNGGRGWLKPVQKGEPSRNPNGHGGRLRQVQSMCRQKAPEAATKLFELMGDSDPRVAFMAAAKVLEWAYGTAPKYDPRDENIRTVLDLRSLSTEQLALLGQMISMGAVKPAEPQDAVVVDATPAD